MPSVPDNVSRQTGRVLIVKFGSIGDVIMAIPGAHLLHCSGQSVVWVASQVVAPVLRLYPWIQVIEVNESKLLRAQMAERLAEARRLWTVLRRQAVSEGGFELIATLYYDRRYEWLTAAIPTRRRLRLSSTDRRFTLIAGRHHADEYARILTGRHDGETPTQVSPVPAVDLEPLRLAPADGRTRIVLVPGGAKNVLRDDALRRWPLQKYVELAEGLLKRGFQVALAGGPEDTWVTPHFRFLESRFGPSALVTLVGELSLVETLALLQAASVTVTHDTGPLHLAGLTSTAIVTLFGPTDPHGRLPHRCNCVAIWGGEGFACRPCYDGRNYAPCLHNGCLDQISPEMVLAEVVRLDAAQQRGQKLPPQVVTPPLFMTQIQKGHLSL